MIMDIIKFITVLAYIFGSLAGLLVVARVTAFMCYSEFDKTVDAIKGFRREFPIMTPGIICIVCVAWLFSV